MRKALVFKIILVVFLFGFAFGTSFLVTSFLDKGKFTKTKRRRSVNKLSLYFYNWK